MDRQNAAAAASQETLASFISLQQLEPSPIESPLDLEKQLPDLPTPGPISRSSTLGLSGSGHGSVYYRNAIPFPQDFYCANEGRNSNPPPTLLLLCLFYFRSVPYNKHLSYSTSHTLRPRIRILPALNTALLSITRS